MELKIIIKEILDLVDKNIKNNKSYKIIMLEVFKMIDNSNEKYKVEVSKRIYDYLKYKNDKVYITNLDTIFYFELYTLDKDIVLFELNKTDKNEDMISLTITSENNDIYDTVCTQIIFESELTTWKINQDKIDDDGYYYNYKFEIYRYDKNHKLIKDSCEDELDKDFSKIFFVPLKDARKYRLNFKKYSSFLNYSKKIGIMKKLDELYSGKELLFSEVFEFNELDNFFVDFESDMIDAGQEEDSEEYDESDENDEGMIETYQQAYDKLDKLKKDLASILGTTGEFTMTNNLYMNITNYLKDKNNIISTKGFIIRKINEDYKAFFIKITNESITHISKNITKEEAQEMYKSHEFNKNIFGLIEFFQITNDNTLKLNNN